MVVDKNLIRKDPFIMDKKTPLKLVELMSCAITLGVPLVTNGIVSANNVNEVQNVSYTKQDTKIAFDPNDALTKQALSKVHQDGVIKSVALVTLKDGKTSSVNMSAEDGIYVATLQGNQEGTKYQFAVTYQDGKTVKINNPYVDNKLDTQFSVIGSKPASPSTKTTNFTAVNSDGTMLEMKGTTRDSDSQQIETVNFHLYYVDTENSKKVTDVALPIQLSQSSYQKMIQNTGKANIVPIMENIVPLSTVIAHCPNGYKIVQTDSQSANTIKPANCQKGTVPVGSNNTIELDYNVKAVSSQSANTNSVQKSVSSSTNSKSTNVSVVSSSKINVLSSSEPATSNKNSSSDKKQSEVSVLSTSTSVVPKNKAAITQTSAVNNETTKNNDQGNDNFFGKSKSNSNENTVTNKQAAVTKKDNSQNADTTGNTKNDSSSSSLSDFSSSSSLSSSIESSSSSVASNDNAQSMPQTGEMILRGLGILGVAALACVGGYYGFQAYKKKTNK